MLLWTLSIPAIVLVPSCLTCFLIALYLYVANTNDPLPNIAIRLHGAGNELDQWYWQAKSPGGVEIIISTIKIIDELKSLMRLAA